MSHSTSSSEIPYTVEVRPDTGVFNAKLGIWLFLASEVMLFGALFSAYVMLRTGSEVEWPRGLLSIPMGTLNTFILATSTITTVMAWFALRLKDFNKFKLFQGATVLLAVIFTVIKSFEYRDKFTHYYVKVQEGKEMREFTGHIEGNPFNWSLARLKQDQPALKAIQFHPDAPAVGSSGHPAAPHAGGHAVLSLPVEHIVKLESFGPWRNTFLAIYFTMTALHMLHVIGGALVMAYFWGPGSRMWRSEPERFTNRVEVAGLFWHFVDLVWIFLFPTLYLI
jgi:cytochrome c oxidase subunit 3